MIKNEYCLHLFITPSRASFMQAMNPLGLCSCKSLRSRIIQVSFIPAVLEAQHFSLCLLWFPSVAVTWFDRLGSYSGLTLVKSSSF